MRELKKYLEIGKIVGTHGIKGEVRCEPWCDSPEVLAKIRKLFWDENGENGFSAEYSRTHKNIVLIKIRGVDTVSDAESLRGKTVYADRKDIPVDPGAYFIKDLIGCTVINTKTNETVGEISEISATGANDVWHIKSGEKQYLIPAVGEFIKKIDTKKGIVEICPIKGMLDDEA